VSPAGAITFLNRAGEHITGLSLDRILGDPVERWFPSFGATSRSETAFVTPSGGRLTLGYTRFALMARGGRPIGSAVVFQDLTSFRAMELEVQRSQRLADLGRVAAGLAHELRNPLASMAGSIELLRNAPGVRETDARLMDIVVREAARLEQLVAAFLAFSRPAPPHRRDVELEVMLSEALDVFVNDPAAAQVNVERALAPGLHAWCDGDQVRQVIWNLLANAAHAAVSGDRTGTIRVGCRAEGSHAIFFVEDDGPGIAPAELKQLFTPFFTTKDGGTGLGLATVQRLVDTQNGTVSVDSEPGRGTRFTVRLPAAPPWGPG
jgi:two-component system sensor histidine kinase PilS (NtrC family)